MLMNDEHSEALRALIGKAWANPEFKAQLINDPKQHLVNAGLIDASTLDDPLQIVRVHEGNLPAKTNDDELTFWLPTPPVAGGKLTDDLLEKAVQALEKGPYVKTACCDITVAPSVFD